LNSTFLYVVIRVFAGRIAVAKNEGVSTGLTASTELEFSDYMGECFIC